MLSTADLCDAHSEKVQVLGAGFLHFGGKINFSGKIRTVKLDENNKDLAALLKTEGHDAVAVVDVAAKYVAVVGDNLMGFAKENNWAGIVVNGYVRDTAVTKTIDVGLVALGVCPKKCATPQDALLDKELAFAGVNFCVGDMLYADIDGVITSKEAL